MKRLALLVPPLLCLTAPAAAHHGNAQYDMERELVVSGVVKGFEMNGAHGAIALSPANAPAQTWNIEAPPTQLLLRRGWTPNTLKPGERVSIQLHPNRDGSPGGKTIRIAAADGREILPETRWPPRR